MVERYKREEYVIADKLTLSKMVEFESLEEYFLVQLRNLGVDFIDLYLIHGLDAEKYKYAKEENCFDFIRELKKRGKVKYMEACKQYFNTKYVRLPDLLIDLETARTEGNYKKVMAKYANPVVLILDEWLLLKPTNSEQRDIFELLHRRRKKSSTIFCSQYAFEEWYEQLGGGDSPLADAIIDRIAHDS